ncbi:RECQL4 [Cordylochernes scorpioides]|uniref:DNA 3'-5' helicase n=1 Tax=Cordylochernes scorpioides TaxID=51811 RepID=A0ABY6JWM4_9ARAC|nr:RECQL4 [Cordylochernes scorpioides]
MCRKLESGTINENYVKVNLKKKKYVRGHKHRTGQQIKRAKWKAIQKGRSGGKKGSCFKCKKPGHWAQDCPQAGGGLLPVLEDGEEEDDGDLVTLEQAAASSSGDTAAQLVDDNSTPATQDPPVIPASQSEPEITTVVEPLYQLQEDGQPIDTPLKVSGALYKLGFEQFRAGQEEAVMRILSGQSTLAVLPTGAGKSLIYQLPAYLYAQRSRCFTLVVSPLVALMENQVLEQPPGLVAASLHSGQDPEVRRAIMEQIKNGEVQVLLTSPETLVMGGWTPPAPVAFACLDEVHCLSHSLASHFRPAYLQVLKVLKERLGVRCILGLTATGTQPAMEEVARRLGGAAIVGFDMSATPVVPANILVSVSRDPNKDQTLVELFNGPRFSQLDSILVYCTRREETERLAMFLRTSLQGSFRTVGKKKVHAWDCEAFHAGLTPYKKKQVQQKFSSGRLRVVVATVALGMGLHHAKLGGVVHYDLPASPERYVQEVGRAGRNGNPAHCHLLLSPQGWDLRELRRHVYANSVDRSTLRRLLNKVFKTCNCQEDAECPGHEVALPLEKLVEELDLREQTIMTLLSWLELAEQRWLEVKPPITAECLLRCYGGASQMAALAQKDPVVREALSGNTATGSLTFNVVDVAAKLGFEARHVKKTLKQLEWDKQGGRYRRSGFLVEFSGQAAHLVTRPGLGLEDRDAMLDHLHATVREQESHGLRCLLRLHALFHSISQSSVTDCLEATDPAHGQQLREALRTYFTVGELPELPTKFGPTPLTEEEELNLRRVVSALVGTHHDHSFTPRAVARILHGIESPQFPAVVWGRVRGTWRSCLHLDFPDVLRVAAQEMRYLRG